MRTQSLSVSVDLADHLCNLLERRCWCDHENGGIYVRSTNAGGCRRVISKQVVKFDIRPPRERSAKVWTGSRTSLSKSLRLPALAGGTLSDDSTASYAYA